MATPAGTTQESVADLLQNKYIPGLIRQFNDSYPNLTYIRQNTDDLTTEGDQAVIALETGLNEAGGVHGESADVASAVSPQVSRVTLKLKQMTFRARISWRIMKKARTTSNAFARALDLTMRSTRDAFLLTSNQYFWGDGSGVMGRVKASAAGPPVTITINRAYGLTDGGQPFALIRPGQTLHLLDTIGFQVGVSDPGGTWRVDEVDVDTDPTSVICKVTQLGAQTQADIDVNMYVYLQNTIAGWTDTDETEDNAPPMGMLGFYDRDLVNPLQGSSAAVWTPPKVTVNQATVITDMNRVKTTFLKRDPKGRIAYHIASYETRNRWYNALVQKAEWRNVETLDGGAWDVAVYDGRPVFADHTAPDGRWFIVPSGDYINRYSASQFIEVINDDNSVLHQVANKTVFDVMFSALYEPGIKRRNVLVSAVGMNW